MHELSIAEALIEQVEASLGCNQAAAIHSVRVAIGELSGVSPEALETAFPLAAEGTRLAGAVLVIERIQAVGSCDGCRRESSLEFPFPVCSHCGSTDMKVLRGREMDLVSVDIEEPSPIIAVPDGPVRGK